LERDLGGVVADKGDEHFAYEVDEYANRILYDVIGEYDIKCHVFSEEGGWRKVADHPQHLIICDPFCNTALAVRGFREAAVAICITDAGGEFIACAIGDLQIERVFYADSTGAHLWEPDRRGVWRAAPMAVSRVRSLDEAFVVTSLLKRERRVRAVSEPFYVKARAVHGVDGAIMIGRLASGYIDAYLDPFKGQPLYEVPCCEMVRRAGGVVTDTDGRPFSLPKVIEGLLDDPKARYKIVAACTEELHRELLNNLTSDVP
jgi:fructose-1,6-bisphosphatase/inositol monophosphatase family enzyme